MSDFGERTTSPSLASPVRPSSLDTVQTNPGSFPTDAFEFDDIKVESAPEIRVKSPWVLEATYSAYTTGGHNYIINGDMAIAQRGTSFTSPAALDYTLDRWQWRYSGAMRHTITQSSDVPTVAEAGRKIPNSILIDCTTVDSALAGTDYASLCYGIEGKDFEGMSQKITTLSFWVKATKTGVYTVGFVNSGGDRTCVLEYTVITTATWEKKTVTLPASPSAGTWLYTTGLGLRLYFNLAAGADYNVAAGAWQSAVAYGISTSNQVNACDNTANNFQLTDIMLNEGSVAAPFRLCGGTPAQEFELCRRFYRRYTATALYTTFGAGLVYNNGLYGVAFEGRMRTLTSAGYSALRVGDGVSAAAVTSIYGFHQTTGNICLDLGCAAGLTPTNAGFVQADNNAAAYIEFIGEL